MTNIVEILSLSKVKQNSQNMEYGCTCNVSFSFWELNKKKSELQCDVIM